MYVNVMYALKMNHPYSEKQAKSKIKRWK